MNAMKTAVLSNLSMRNITELTGHMFETAVGDNHIFNLVKVITECYCTIRFHHLAKEKNLSGKKIRKKMNKLVLFTL